MEQKERFYVEKYIRKMEEFLIIIDAHERVKFLNKKAKKYFRIKSIEDINIKKYFNKIQCDDINGEAISYEKLPFIKIIKSDLKVKKCDEVVRYKNKYLRIESMVIGSEDKSKVISILIKDVSKIFEISKFNNEKNEELTNFAKELIVKCALNNDLRKKEHEKRIGLEEAERLNKDFFSFVSHELRTPLAIIISSIQLCRELNKKEISGNINYTLVRINENAKKLLKLVNNILDLTKANAGHLDVENSPTEIVSFSENIVDSVSEYAKIKNLNIVFDTTEEEGVVEIDRDKYEKIVLNLLSNAIKYSPKNKNIYFNLILKQHSFKVIVKDEGIGIPEDKKKYIFKRFTRINSVLSKEHVGTGIGLSLVEKLVKLMNGTIEVYSEINKGSSFEIEFKCPVLYGVYDENIIDYDVSSCRNISLEFTDIY